MKEKLRNIEEPMSLTETAVRASYQVVVTDKKLNPVGMGSGCILYYQKRLFFVTVAHVTDEKDVLVHVETNQSSVNGKTPNYHVGGMNYFDLFKIKDIEKLKEEKDLSDNNIKHIETLDFALAELKEPIEAYQNDVDFMHHGTVTGGTKIIIPDVDLQVQPEADQPLLFCGAINGNLNNGILSRQQKLTVDCEFLESHDDYFYKLRLPNVISDESEFKGTSGAPVFDCKYRFTGLVSYGFVGLPFIFIFKNSEIKKLIDTYIAANPK